MSKIYGIPVATPLNPEEFVPDDYATEAYVNQKIAEADFGDKIPDSVIQYTPQALTEEQKAQARTNIGAAIAPIAYRYNTTELPPLPQWDKTIYPYAAIIRSGTMDASLYASSVPLIYHTNNDISGNRYLIGTTDGECIAYDVPLSLGKWNGTDGWERYPEGDKAITTSGGITVYSVAWLEWCNHDIYKKDETVYRAASAPVHVYADGSSGGNGGGNGGSSDAVLYTEQNLTPEQQAQARKNIGAEAAKGEIAFTEEGKQISFNASGGEVINALTTLDAAGQQTVTLQHCGENLYDMREAILTHENITYEEGWFVVRHDTPTSSKIYSISICFG